MNNQKGFGLIEITVAMGILSIIMLGTMQAIQNSIIVSQTADAKANVTSLVASMAGMAANDITCTRAVTKISQQYSDEFKFDTVKTGVVLSGSSLTIEKLSYVGAELVYTSDTHFKTYYGNLTLSASSNKQIMGSKMFAPRTIASMYVTVDPSNTIVSCSPSLTEPPAKVVTPVPVVKKDDDNEEFRHCCSDIGGEFSEGKCTFHSERHD